MGSFFKKADSRRAYDLILGPELETRCPCPPENYHSFSLKSPHTFF